MTKLHCVSHKQARKLALVSQRLPRSGFDRGLKGTHQAIKHLGYIQIDTISVVERAHHHTLWNRVPHYRHHFLDRLVESRKVFEYWAHAAAYLPMEDFRFCLPRMHAVKTGQKHWYKKNEKLMQQVLTRIRQEGPMQARDFAEHRGHSGGMWEWGPIKQAIESLFIQGDLLITRRENFQKVFDLTENVLPAGIDTRLPTKADFARFLIDRHLSAHGIAHLSEFGYLRKGMGAAIKRTVNELVEDRKLIEVQIFRRPGIYYVNPDFEATLGQRLSLTRIRILSPFDNLVIQRKRILRLFDFDYQLECYVPEKKRKHGYFVLPVLWNGQLVARLDAKAQRKSQRFILRNLWLEPSLKQQGQFLDKLAIELCRFAEFHHCPTIQLGSRLNLNVRNTLQASLDARTDDPGT